MHSKKYAVSNGRNIKCNIHFRKSKEAIGSVILILLFVLSMQTPFNLPCMCSTECTVRYFFARTIRNILAVIPMKFCHTYNFRYAKKITCLF